ncbi:MAG: DUF1684 domain-containing protein [Cyclobacteriaceae bacterium]|nr:DUF1684 domain-containing protein [Flammeovirgaceae bacterium]
MKSRLTFLMLFIGSLAACNNSKKPDPQALAAYQAEIDAWHAKRVEEVLAPNGWVNLIGLFWLQPGLNTWGSAPDNHIVFPEGTVPPSAGFFFVNNGTVTLTVEKGVDIRLGGNPISKAVIFHPDLARNPQLEMGALRWNIIKREDKLGIRLRDLESDALKNFQGIPRFAVDPAWTLPARFEKYDSLRTIAITNIIGQTYEQKSPGALLFRYQGRELRLDVLDGQDKYFVVFADATTGKTTYGGGRFIDVKKPDATGATHIDFNKAYNPPCVFSPHATCPLPPKQNVLPVSVTAGELNYGEQH